MVDKRSICTAVRKKIRESCRKRKRFRKEPEEPQGAKQAENRLSDQYPCVPVTGDDPSERQNMEQG